MPFRDIFIVNVFELKYELNILCRKVHIFMSHIGWSLCVGLLPQSKGALLSLHIYYRN